MTIHALVAGWTIFALLAGVGFGACCAIWYPDEVD